MLRKLRTCSCGKVELTFTRISPVCRDCAEQIKREHRIAEERRILETMYTDVEGPVGLQHNHRLWTFTHSCGTRQTWIFPNIRKQLKRRPDSVPCSACGGKERMSKAMAAFIEKYRITNWSEWREYKRHVTKLTNATWKLHESSINPHGYKRTRGNQGWHLDHRKSVIQCYLDGDPPEFAARRENLQMLPAFDNLSKGRKCS